MDVDSCVCVCTHFLSQGTRPYSYTPRKSTYTPQILTACLFGVCSTGRKTFAVDFLSKPLVSPALPPPRQKCRPERCPLLESEQNASDRGAERGSHAGGSAHGRQISPARPGTEIARERYTVIGKGSATRWARRVQQREKWILFEDDPMFHRCYARTRNST